MPRASIGFERTLVCPQCESPRCTEAVTQSWQPGGFWVSYSVACPDCDHCLEADGRELSDLDRAEMLERFGHFDPRDIDATPVELARALSRLFNTPAVDALRALREGWTLTNVEYAALREELSGG
ncbi:MAG: hypothetical protein AAGE52_24955 [Myxococcota bacterium]